MITRKTLRQPECDGLRGVAAMVVASTHYLSAFFPYAAFGDRFVNSPRFEWEAFFFFPPFGILTAGSFAVCLFFVLSGYVLSRGHLGADRAVASIFYDLIKRPIRLGGVVIFTVMLACLFWGCGLYSNRLVSDITKCWGWFGYFWSVEFNFWHFLSEIPSSLFESAGRYNPPLWTIKIELYGAVYVYLFLLIFGGLKFRWVFLLLLLVYLRNSPYFGFFLGVAIADIQRSAWLPLPSVRASFWLACCLVIGGIYFASYPSYVSSDFMQSTIYGALPSRAPLFVGYPMLAAAMLFVSAISFHPLRRLLSSPVLMWVGSISYAFYALHFLVLGTVVGWLFLEFFDKIGYLAAWSLASALGLLITFALAVCTTRLIDRPACRCANWVATHALKCIQVCRDRL